MGRVLKHMALYGTHDIFRADNQQGSAIRRQSAREARAQRILSLRHGLQDPVHRMRLRRPGVARKEHH
ncbi:unnamed protein product [Leptidea sinapis]|uniref:Uncharacterized protein n=1 Tax=Leptidea sinapis TaxID=189913 RepID=A0A5E4Q4P8_9NEOP|nr:unnamed protein product [Leptidea sinapis]